MRTVKTPEIDNRVVDYLYDDLPDAQREAFSAYLESDETAATEASSIATLLKIYREESDELTPSMAATERLLREASRAHQSLWTRLFGDLLPRVVLRPAVGFAMVAALLIGGGVFYILSQGSGPGQGPGHGSGSAAEAVSQPDRTIARAPAALPTSGETRTVLAEKGPRDVAGERDRFNSDGDVSGNTDKGLRLAGDKSEVAANGYLYKNNKRGALAVGGTGGLDLKERKGLRGRRSRPAKAKQRKFFSVVSTTRGRDVPSIAQPAAKSPSRSPVQAVDALRSVQKKPVGSKAAPKGKSGKKLTPPALHNSARKNLAKGKVAVACRMFGSLVRGNRNYIRRADALLGWARCEMARGSYSRAAQLVRQLINQYPKWKKSGAKMLAQIKRRQAQAALRAQRVRRVRRKYAAPRAAPDRRARPRRSSTSD